MSKSMNKTMQATWRQVGKDWKRARKELKKRWEKLTDSDVHQLDNQLDKLVDLFQERYGQTWEDAASTLERYLGGYRVRTQEAINTTRNRRQRKARTAPWFGILLLVGLVAVGYFWPHLSSQVQQIGGAWRTNGDENAGSPNGSQNPNESGQAQGPSYGQS